MKISTEYPPNYAEIKKVFPLCKEYKATFCYGDTIYSPFNKEVPADIQAHEEVHSKQQGELPDVWWYKYLNDTEFRLRQEIEAYGTQLAFALKLNIPWKLRDWIKEKLAQSLSGELYGNMLTYREAESKIRNYAKTL